MRHSSGWTFKNSTSHPMTFVHVSCGASTSNFYDDVSVSSQTQYYFFFFKKKRGGGCLFVCPPGLLLLLRCLLRPLESKGHQFCFLHILLVS